MNKKIKGSGGGGGKGGGGGGGRVAQESPDSLRSISYAQVLDLVSEGEIEGLANGLKSVYFNNTPLQNDNGSYNFTDTTVTLVNGTQSQSHIAGFSAVENENIVGVQVEKSGTGIVRQITNSDVDAVRVRVSVPVLTSQNMSNGDISGTTVQYAVDIQSNGGGYIPQILGSVWDVNKVTIASTTLAQSNTAVYQLQIQVRNPNDATTYVVQYKSQSSGTWLTAGISVVDSQTTETVSTYDNEWGYQNYEVQVLSKVYTMPVQASGSWEMRITSIVLAEGAEPPYIVSANANYGTPYATISGKTTSKYERSHRIQLTGSAPWDVRVRRLTNDSTASSLQNKTYFEAYTEIIDGKFRYPNSAIVGVRIDSSQFNSIPTRAYDLKLLKVKVPTNYNPTTRAYTGIWDGTFKVSWTDNPAWCFYDLLTNTRYGLGEFIDPAQVDKWTLYSISQYCDQLVDNGNGGTEPRYTCNLYLQNRDEAYTVVNSMASIFRGMPYWSSGSLTLGYDAPADPEYQFTNSNVVDGTFNYAGSSLKARHTVALVTWNDPEDNFRQKVEYVEDAESITRYGIIQTEVVAVGCTSRGQANRVGRWILFTEKSETEMVTFKTGIEGNPLRPSQIIQVSDELRAGLRRGGRVTSATTTAITIDDVDIQNQSGVIGGTLSVILPDGTLETKTISNVVGQVITCVSGFSDTPQKNTVWVIETTSIQTQLFRVISVSEEEGGFSVAALEHNPNKYAEIEDGLNLPPRDISNLSIVPVPVTGISAEEALVENGSDVGVKIIVSWEAVVGATSYEVSYKLSDNNYVVLPQTKGCSLDILNADAGAYIFKVVAVNSIGKRSIPTELSQNIYGKTGLLTIDPPTSLAATSQSDLTGDGSVQTAIIATWNAPTSLFVSQYEVQYIRGSGNFDYGFISESASSNTDYGTITTVETFSINYGSITDPVPVAETDFNSRFTGERSFKIVPSLEGVTYTIRVRAINKIGVKSDWTSIDYIAFGDLDPPADPEFYAIKTGYKQLIIEWDLPPDLDYDATEVFRNIVNNRFSSTKIGSIRGTAYIDSGLGINETYYYWIRFVDRSGNPSGFSETISGTTAFIDSDQFSAEVMNLFSEAGAYGIEPVATLPLAGDFDGQIKYNTTTNKLYRWDSATSIWTDDIFSIASGSVDFASFASGIEPVAIVSALPNPTGWTGAKIVFLTTDNKIYRYTGTAWTTSILTADLSGSLSIDVFPNTLRPVEVVGVLPSTGNFVGRVATLTTDGKLYRYTSTGWVASVASSDISGAVTNAQIEGLAASKVTGTLTNAQIADVAAAKVTGQITGTQITDGAISTPKIVAGSVTTALLATGAVTADQIGANAVTAVKIEAGAITTAKLAVGAVTASTIAADAITSDKIAANAVTADEIAANSITTAKISAGAITSSLISANAITATQLAAGSVVAGKIAAAAVSTTELAADSISADKLKANIISADKIQAGAIQTDKIAANAITGGLIAAAGVITQVAQIGDGLITNAKIDNLAVTEGKIANLAVSTAKIGDLQVSTLKIGNNAVTIPVTVSTDYVPLATGGGGTTVQSLVFTSTGAPRLIEFSCEVQIILDTSTFPFTSTAKRYRAILYRNGSPFGETNSIAGVATQLSFSRLDTSAAGTYTYSVAVTPLNIVSGDSPAVFSAILTVIEVKK